MPIPSGAPLKLSLLLNGGVNNRSEPELVQPVAAQGSTIKLRASTNTRLSRRVGTVARSPSFVQVDNPLAAAVPGEARYGLFTAAHGKCTLALRAPYHLHGSPVYADAGRVTPGNALSTYTGDTATTQVSAATPLVVDAGAVGQYAAISNIANVYSETLDQVWTFYWAYSSSDYSYPYASVRKGDGTLIAYPQILAVSGGFLPVAAETAGLGYPLWCGVTEHGANGIVVWWQLPTDHTIYCMRLTVNASGLIVALAASSSVAVLPAYATSSADPAYGIDVCSGGDSYAYIATTLGASPNNGRVIQWDVVSQAAVGGYSFAGASLGAGQTAISSQVIRGTRYVACNFGSVTNNQTTVGCFAGGSMTPTWTVVLAEQGGQAVGFLDVGYDDAGNAGPRTVHLIGVVSGSSAAGLNRTSLATNAPWICRTIMRTCHLATGSDSLTVATEISLPFRSLQTHAAQWSPTTSTTFPVFGTAPTYGKGTDAVGQADYVDDPSIDFYAVRDWQHACPIARIGCVRGTLQAPARIQVERRLQSKSFCVVGQRGFAAYRQLSETSGISSADVALGFQGSSGRYAVLDFSPTQLSVAHDKDGSVYVASALPYQWDGRDLFEMGGFLHTPHLSNLISGGSPLAGNFHARVVHRFQDAAGSMHRSRTSAIHEFSLAAQATYLFADPGQTMSRRIPLLYYYASEANGKTEHLFEVTSDLWSTLNSAVSTAYPMVYTTEADGTELAPQPPPPAWDFGIVGSRMWGVDAELRTRAFYSKLRVAGIGYEFHPALEVAVPSGSGDLFAVREWAGFPVLIAERAVYQVSGDGPTNQVGGGGGSFSPPVKISDYGCTNTASVAVFPTGMIWQFRDRFVLLDANGVQLVPDFLCTEDVSAALVLTRYSEVLFFSATTAGARVYNYEFGRWTTWDSETLPDPVTQVSLLPYDPDTALVYSASTGILRRLECDTYGAAAHMTLETDWLLLGGDFQDHVELRDLVFSAVVNGPHGLEVNVYTDYEDDTATTERSWTADEIATLSDATGRYTLRIDPVQPNCRAVRIRVRDVVEAGDNTQGMGPRALTVSYQLNGQLFEDSFLQNSHK
jgi:hypothetical protein